MRRFLVGAGWFVLLWIGCAALGGGIVGAVASVGSADAAEAARVGAEAGTRFGAQYGGIMFLAALAFATIGTVLGLLPGTRAK